MLLRWPGSDPELLPVLFISHYDIVPVTDGTEGDWTHGPFSGAVADGHLWGRGTLDVKYSVAALLEAASRMIQDGVMLRRTVMFAFGHDEEVMIGEGMGAAAADQSSC
jgi:carboxypeptidase PM20D1